MIRIPYWGGLVSKDTVAFIERGDTTISYLQFSLEVDKWAKLLDTNEKSLVLICAENNVTTTCVIYGAWLAGHTVMLLPGNIPPDRLADLISLYSPRWVLKDNVLQPNYVTSCFEIHPDLALLLSTSGSTGNPKFVKLSHDNLKSNVEGIVESLSMDNSSIAAGHLDLSYSYGLSVLSSHLFAGASMAFCRGKITDRTFWSDVASSKVTQFPGVPTHYQILNKMNLGRILPKSVNICTQAGGHLNIHDRTIAYTAMEKRDGQFHIMYGQTEAAPRMSVLKHEDFESHSESVGKPLPNCRFEIERPLAGSGSIIFYGPNVMMGYANGRSDLQSPPSTRRKLNTGDIGTIDSNGFLTVHGRNDRIVKINGLRVELDYIEKLCGEGIFAISTDHNLTLTSMKNPSHWEERVRESIMQFTNLPPSILIFTQVPEIPTTQRGKIDYQRLSRRIHGKS